jgi:enamine deaminase RidA (YjgF/YER057c/UK114 family)
MTSERINPAELARPSGFSHAVSVAGGAAGGGAAGGGAAGGGAAAGRMVFLAGQTGVDRDGNVADGGVVPQFERAMTNLLTALGAAGGLPSDLVSLTIYLTDMADYQAHAREIGAVWRRLAGTDYPAMAAVGVTRLWLPGLVVEIQGIAVVSG